jgi:hypothetical protein
MSQRKSPAASSSSRAGLKLSNAILGLDDHLYYKRGRRKISRGGVDLSGSCRTDVEDVGGAFCITKGCDWDSRRIIEQLSWRIQRRGG